jgi:hypothetical protein
VQHHPGQWCAFALDAVLASGLGLPGQSRALPWH